MKYNPKKIEGKWQKRWQQLKLYNAKDKSKKPKQYILIEFPYPSGEGLHMGHLRPYTAGDVYSRLLRMCGAEVMYPMGWDAFGLPAENFAIKKGVHPSVSTMLNIKNAKRQVQSWGMSFDWSREINTTDPAYYKWTQWIFLQFYKAGLAYEATGLINWCPKDKTGLANEEVIDGKCERCGTVVEKKELRQWYLKITAYAEKLLEGLKNLPKWPEQVKLQQENWIGKSEGAEIDFEISDGSSGSKSNFLILHGKRKSPPAAPLSGFIPWLEKSLKEKGYKVQVPMLPHPNEPNDLEQAEFVRKNCKIDGQTVIIGHSFGGVVALRLLEQGIRLNQVILLSTPYSGKFLDGKIRASVTAAVQRGFKFDLIKQNAKDFKVLFDTSDGIVPLSDGEEFAKRLGVMLLKTKAETPHFTGEVEPEVLDVLNPSIKVFTTRPDTIFGATYMVLAPEHALVQSLKFKVQNWKEVQEYIEQAAKKTDMQRAAVDKEKTGVVLKGISAINPATGEKIPVWIADYVLMGYGTGAIMAVPAHDERDFEFAKKYRLPIKEVVAPYTILTGVETPRSDNDIVKIEAATAIVKHWEKELYYVVEFNSAHQGFAGGRLEAGETPQQAVVREVAEETGYSDVKKISVVFENAFSRGYKSRKGYEEICRDHIFAIELASEKRGEIIDHHTKDGKWMTKEQILALPTFLNHHRLYFEHYLSGKPFVGEGFMVNSGRFDGMESERAKWEITGFVNGIKNTQFKLRDWVFSRQRYWGEPIPIIHCPHCGIVPVPEKDLPVKLPNVKKYEPTGTGESPLAVIDKWVNVKCPNCKSPAKRETNTMPQWAGSSWYFLRYADPKNSKKVADKKLLKHWLPIDVYFGGMEHTTLHLLYSRFWNLFLHDQGLVPVSESYDRRVPHGIILAEDGEKMSKSRGNVVNPDEIVKLYGADTLRMYELFLGPHEQTVSWHSRGIIGVRRFLEKVWRMADSVQSTEYSGRRPIIHKSIKKVTEDIEHFRFNTAVSALMILANELESEKPNRAEFEALLRLLAPFAPHLSEELWHQLGHKKSIHVEPWPQYDESLLQEDAMNIAVQINGKHRATIKVVANSGEDHVKEIAQSDPNVKKHLEGKEVKKVIYVPGKIINYVL